MSIEHITRSAQRRRAGRLLRHHSARRRAVARQQPQRHREAGDSPPARPPGGRRHRGRLSGQQPRRLRGRAVHRPRGQGRRHLRTGPLHRERHPHLLGRHQGRRAPAHPHLRQHLRHPSEAPDAGRPRRGRSRSPARWSSCASRSAPPTWSSRPWTPPAPTWTSWPRCWLDGHRRRGDHHQRARHRGLRAAHRVRGADGAALREDPAAGPGGAERSLPQRPGCGGGQLAGGHRGRRHAGGGGRERHGRAGRQRRARRDRHGPRHPQGHRATGRAASSPPRSPAPAAWCRASPAI